MAEPQQSSDLPKPKQLDEAGRHRVAVLLDTIERSNDLKFNLTIGRCILAEIYWNKLEVWNEYNRGDKSVEGVVEELRRMGRPRWSPTRIYRDVKLVEQDAYHGGLAEKWPKLSVRHFVLGQQLRLQDQAAAFTEASSKNLSVLDFLERVNELKGGASKVTVRPRVDQIYQAFEKLRLDLGTHDQLFADLREAGMNPAILENVETFFDSFTLILEDLEIALANMGAHVPEDKLETFKQHQQAQADAAAELAKDLERVAARQ